MLKLAWAERCLRVVNQHLREPGAETGRELLLAGVPKRTVAELYPFSLSDYAVGLAQLCALRPIVYKQLREIFKPIDVLYDLALHLPEPQDKALWSYMQRDSRGAKVSSYGRLHAVSPSLLATARAADLVQPVEKMLLTIHLLHLLHDYPFAGEAWPASHQQKFDESLLDIKAELIAWADLLEANAERLWNYDA